MARKYEAGASLPVLAREYGGAHVTVRAALLRHGVTTRGPGRSPWRDFSDEQGAEIIRRWHSGESQSKIAAHFRTTQSVVSRYLIAHGIEPVQRRGAGRGPRHPSWRGGVTYIEGYRWVKLDRADPYFCMASTQDYVAEHRLVMARHLGRALYPDETVHHRRGKTENDIEHLELWSNRHPKGQRVEDIAEWAVEMLQRYRPDLLRN